MPPDQIGTSPWDMARWMSDNSDTFGTAYGWHVVDDTDSRNVNSALRGAVKPRLR